LENWIGLHRNATNPKLWGLLEAGLDLNLVLDSGLDLLSRIRIMFRFEAIRFASGLGLADLV
jgi:hypothetical protein